jgi:hypothetical protein
MQDNTYKAYMVKCAHMKIHVLLSYTNTGVPTIQFVLYLRYDMYNKDAAKLFFHV